MPSWAVLSSYLKATPLPASKAILGCSNPSSSTTSDPTIRLQAAPVQGRTLSNECQGKGEKQGDMAERWHSCSDALWWGKRTVRAGRRQGEGVWEEGRGHGQRGETAGASM